MRISDWSSDVCSSDLIAVFWWLFGYSGAPIPSLHFVHGRSSGSCVGRLASVILASARLMPMVRMNRNQRQTTSLKVDHPNSFSGLPYTTAALDDSINQKIPPTDTATPVAPSNQIMQAFAPAL